MTCGPTLAHALRLLQQELAPSRSGPDASAYASYAQGRAIGYRERVD